MVKSVPCCCVLACVCIYAQIMYTFVIHSTYTGGSFIAITCGHIATVGHD